MGGASRGLWWCVVRGAWSVRPAKASRSTQTSALVKFDQALFKLSHDSASMSFCSECFHPQSQNMAVGLKIGPQRADNLEGLPDSLGFSCKFGIDNEPGN